MSARRIFHASMESVRNARLIIIALNLERVVATSDAAKETITTTMMVGDTFSKLDGDYMYRIIQW